MLRARTVGLLTVLAAAALVAWSPRLTIGAGRLSAGHGEIQDRCAACHAPFRGPRVERCLWCHATDSIPSASRAPSVASDRLVTLRQLHRDQRASDCLACHTDHEGPDPARATKPFAHEALGRDVRARCATCHDGVQPQDAVHRRPVACGACHRTDAWTPATFRHDSLEPTLAARCVECHAAELPRDDGLHDRTMRACADCHRVDRWTPATFEHGRWFRLDRDHDARCATCHQDAGRFTSYTCYGCHEHTPQGMQRKHAEEGVTRDLASCARCHRSADEHEGRGRDGRGHHDD